MSTTVMQTAPAITITTDQPCDPPAARGATMTKIQERFNRALRHLPGGGPGGSGGLGGPREPGGPHHLGQQGGPDKAAGQVPIQVAGDIKMMGQLPQTFTEDHTQADNFIEEVKGYLRLN